MKGVPLSTLEGDRVPVVTVAQPNQVWRSQRSASERDGQRRLVRVLAVVGVTTSGGRDALGNARPKRIRGQAVLVPITEDGGPDPTRYRSRRRLRPSDGGVCGFELVADPNSYRAVAFDSGSALVATSPRLVGDWTTRAAALEDLSSWNQSENTRDLPTLVQRRLARTNPPP